MKLFTRSTRPTACPSCQSSVEPDQLSCVECGRMLTRRSALADAAWKVPVTVLAAVGLVLATGIGFASGSVVQDGDVGVAEAPAPQQALPPGEEEDGDGDGGGSDDLSQLDPPDGGDGDGDGSDLDDGGDGDGDGDGDSDDGGDGDGDGDGSSDDSSDGDDGAGADADDEPHVDEQPEIVGDEEERDLAEIDPGEDGYTVALKVTSSRAAATREARAAVAEAESIPAGVISRADFPELSGAFVAFAGGPFDSRAEAELARDNYAAVGFSGEVIARPRLRDPDARYYLPATLLGSGKNELALRLHRPQRTESRVPASARPRRYLNGPIEVVSVASY